LQNARRKNFDILDAWWTITQKEKQEHCVKTSSPQKVFVSETNRCF